MSQKYEKISPTAIGVASLRAQFTNMPYSNEIYKRIKKIAHVPFFMRIPRPFNRLARFFPRALETVAGLEIRYLSVNDVLKTLDDSWSIIEVASGLSARSLDWSEKYAIYLETDLADMLEIKKGVFAEILQVHRIPTPIPHAFEILNALDYMEWDRLGKTYFPGKRAKIAVINEGLLGYLSLEEKIHLRDNIKAFFETYASEGRWITPDFSTRGRLQASRITRYVRRSLERDTERKFHWFTNRDAVTKFLNEAGFEVSFLSNDTILNKLTCIPKMHLKSDRILQILPNYQACSAQIIKK